MGKKILSFANIEIEKNEDAVIEKVLVSKKVSLGEKTINTFLATCIMMIKLSRYIQCFLKQALM